MTKKINFLIMSLCLMFSGLTFGSTESESEDVKNLRNAVNFGYADIAVSLIDKGTPIDGVHFGGTLLHESALCGSRKITSALISKGVDINAQNKRKETPLYCAVSQGEVEVVSELLDANADPNIADEDGITPLHLAIKLGVKSYLKPTKQYVECFALLLSYSMYKKDGELHFPPDRNGHTVSEIFEVFEYDKNKLLSPEEREKAEKIKSEYGFDRSNEALTNYISFLYGNHTPLLYDNYPGLLKAFNDLKDKCNIKSTKSARSS